MVVETPRLRDIAGMTGRTVPSSRGTFPPNLPSPPLSLASSCSSSKSYHLLLPLPATLFAPILPELVLSHHPGPRRRGASPGHLLREARPALTWSSPALPLCPAVLPLEHWPWVLSPLSLSASSHKVGMKKNSRSSPGPANLLAHWEG